MHYETIKDLKPADFKRLTGVHPETFQQMLDALTDDAPDFGRPSKLSRADQLLLTLTYWREYRTMFHIAQDFGVSEATACRTITKVENSLMRSGRFRLPGKKALRPSQTQYTVIVLDATESPVERPQKNSGVLTVARRSVTPRKRR